MGGGVLLYLLLVLRGFLRPLCALCALLFGLAFSGTAPVLYGLPVLMRLLELVVIGLVVAIFAFFSVGESPFPNQLRKACSRLVLLLVKLDRCRAFPKVHKAVLGLW